LPAPALARVALSGDIGGALAAVPAAPGVGQILGPDGRSLIVAPASNLRRWAASYLGRGRPPAAGRRPRTNLAGIAREIAWIEADAPFRQRLLYERLVAPLVPVAARRDLKPPSFLHLDPLERFPRVTVRSAGADPDGLYGPFRDRRTAEKARDAVQRLFPLRPCDYAFEPDPALPLGLGCLYAQVRSCAAPCLRRVGEEEYRTLASGAADWLADPSLRGDAPSTVPATVAAVAGARAVVVDAGKSGITLFPVRAGRVLDAAALAVARGGLALALEQLAWPGPGVADDWPWLLAWLRSPKARACFVVVPEPATPGRLFAVVRAAVPARFAALLAGGNVGPSRGGA
jgi:hypothetical protein